MSSTFDDFFVTIVGNTPLSAGGGLSLQPNFQKEGGGGAWQDLNF